MELARKTAHELASLMASGEVSSRDVVESLLEWISTVDRHVRAYLHVSADRALAAADEVDRRRRNGEALDPLAGVPAALKDNICTLGIPTTCGSRILGNYVPPYNATVTARLEARGIPIIGKTNMDEFAMGSSCENSGFFPTHNPWDLQAVPGGSSGGSAATVASDQAPFALGSDTGGSIRQPASFCGVVGLKPTYGAVSRFGLIAYASSLDQIGPLTKDVTDCALVLNAIAGHDPADSTSALFQAPDYTASLVPEVKGLRIGVPREYFAAGVKAGVRDLVHAGIRLFADLGAEVEECSLPHTDHALSAYYLIAPAEASSNLARYDGVKYGLRVAGEGDYLSMFKATRAQGFGPEVKRRIMLGSYALSAGYYDQYYLKAQKVRTLVKQDFEKAFESFDFLVTPTSPTAAFPLGEKTGDPLSMYLSDVCTIPANMAGIPALSLPCGLAGGKPVGMQLLGPPFGEGILLRAAYAFEQHTEHHLQKPPLLESLRAGGVVSP